MIEARADARALELDASDQVAACGATPGGASSRRPRPGHRAGHGLDLRPGGDLRAVPGAIRSVRRQPERVIAPPSAEHPLGQDLQGRDELSRIIYGARNPLQIGIISVTIGVSIGLIGAIAGYMGGWADSVLMRVMDMMLAIPGLLFAIAIVACWVQVCIRS